MNINFVQKSFFDFTHDQKFDEIWADPPVRGKKTKEEQDAFYGRFFENGMVKKYLRLHDNLHLKQEFCIREKDGAYFYIIIKKEPERSEAEEPVQAEDQAVQKAEEQAEGQTASKEEQAENQAGGVRFWFSIPIA